MYSLTSKPAKPNFNLKSVAANHLNFSRSNYTKNKLALSNLLGTLTSNKRFTISISHQPITQIKQDKTDFSSLNE